MTCQKENLHNGLFLIVAQGFASIVVRKLVFFRKK